MSNRSIPVPVWRTVDGTLDNVAAVELIAGDLAVEAHATALREAGWAAMSHHPERHPESGWPPEEAELRIELSAADEDFIRQALEDGQRMTLQILAEPDLEPSVRQEQEEARAAGDLALRFWRTLSTP